MKKIFCFFIVHDEVKEDSEEGCLGRWQEEIQKDGRG